VGGIGRGLIKDVISCWEGLRKSRNFPHDSRYLGLDSRREPPICKFEPVCLVTTMHDTAIRCVSVSVKPFVSVISGPQVNTHVHCPFVASFINVIAQNGWIPNVTHLLAHKQENLTSSERSGVPVCPVSCRSSINFGTQFVNYQTCLS
jgi:hypothetical protein